MGIIALLLIILLGADSVMSFAMSPGNLLHREVTSRDESASEDTLEDDIVDESADQESAETDIAGLDDEQIWAQIDKNELRSLVDVDILEEQIDSAALLSRIDKKEIEKKINDTNLLASMTADEIRQEFYELKDSDVLKPYMNIVYSLEDGDDSIVIRDNSEDEDINEPDIMDEDGPQDDIDINSEEMDSIVENGVVDVSSKSGKYSVVSLSNSEEEEIPIEDSASASDSNSGSDSDQEVITKIVPVTPMDGDLPNSGRLVDVVNIQYPIIGENSPFDFIVDPMGLIYETSAARYDGGRVEEGAGVLFRNTGSDYSFSGKSDLLSIVNKGNVPVKVEIIASMDYSGQAVIVDDISKLEGTDPSMFFGLMGESGLLSVFTKEGKTVVDMILEPAPEGTYAYIWNENLQRYEMKMLEGVDESKFDTFKFGVMANCNKEGNWSGVTSLPRISVTWKTEPIYTDWDLVNSELDEADKPLFAAFKRYKLHELRQQEMDRLVGIALDDLFSEELDRLIDIEVEKLARERFYELKGQANNDEESDDDEDDSDEALRRRSENLDEEEDIEEEEEDFEEEEEEVDDIEDEEEEEPEESEDEEPYIEDDDSEVEIIVG
jgi:hypothetical protein